METETLPNKMVAFAENLRFEDLSDKAVHDAAAA